MTEQEGNIRMAQKSASSHITATSSAAIHLGLLIRQEIRGYLWTLHTSFLAI